eukprot:5256852-Prorocentrum_lima.AAC.1
MHLITPAPISRPIATKSKPPQPSSSLAAGARPRQVAVKRGESEESPRTFLRQEKPPPVQSETV